MSRPSSRGLHALTTSLVFVVAIASWSVGGVAVPTAASAVPAPRYVRVNQVGYVAGASSKRAWLLAGANLGGTSFDVRDGGNTAVYAGTVGGDLGGWNGTFTHLYPLNFGTFSAPGTYTIVASGATSVPFRIDTAAALYTPLVHNSVDFYRAHRDGFHVDGSLLDRQPAPPAPIARLRLRDARLRRGRRAAPWSGEDRRPGERRGRMVRRRGLRQVRGHHLVRRVADAVGAPRSRLRVLRVADGAPRPGTASAGC